MPHTEVILDEDDLLKLLEGRPVDLPGKLGVFDTRGSHLSLELPTEIKDAVLSAYKSVSNPF